MMFKKTSCLTQGQGKPRYLGVAQWIWLVSTGWSQE